MHVIVGADKADEVGEIEVGGDFGEELRGEAGENSWHCNNVFSYAYVGSAGVLDGTGGYLCGSWDSLYTEPDSSASTKPYGSCVNVQAL